MTDESQDAGQCSYLNRRFCWNSWPVKLIKFIQIHSFIKLNNAILYKNAYWNFLTKFARGNDNNLNLDFDLQSLRFE